ncbi:hypothetical protein L207DRAFT_575125 [Hyaloscypha variabilis F]|uniref:Uncharacterized protein n=1 Tax=Hyaloscypha variabilis (strain UAMH 11265 / GT02V1 / F) TaxID=1149755 RepID=A0A2J6SCG6_HYAVF|nr:hypothetical protein L207DRAFT_575125 [Hyaloscypha variabilis F]
MILTTDMIEKWNVYFNTEVKDNKFIKERDSDEASMKFYVDLCESSETVVEITASGRVFNGHPEARMEIEYNKHRDRANALQEDIDKIADELSDLRLSLHRSMRILFLHNSLRKHDDHQWLQGLADSKYAIDVYTSYVTLTSESEDSDSETET